MSNEMIKTNKFDNMLQAFECDFDLACQGENTFSDLQKNIENGDKRTMQDIELLKELAFLIRCGKAEIRIETNILWYIVYADASGYVNVLSVGHTGDADDERVIVFQNETEATIALGNLKKHNIEYVNAEVKSFVVEEKGKFVDGRTYSLLAYKNGRYE